jgi:uncharacterized RDD family membrane protein YckC
MAQGVSGPPVALEVHVTGRRVLATIVDAIVISVMYFVVGLLVAMLFGGAYGGDGQVGFSLNGLPALVLFILLVFSVFLYYTLMEGYLGRTLGKMLFGIKVVREDHGGVPGLGAAALRTVLRLIDGILFYAVAFVSVQVTEKNQRLGDMVADTLVVRT